jgi:hypothetical protein
MLVIGGMELPLRASHVGRNQRSAGPAGVTVRASCRTGAALVPAYAIPSQEPPGRCQTRPNPPKL